MSWALPMEQQYAATKPVSIKFLVVFIFIGLIGRDLLYRLFF
jgi:hypothetical protein